MPVIAQIEVIAVAIITILAVISPGPDFAMVTRIALTRGRRAGVLCAIGIGSGVSVHLAYTLIGLGVVFASNVWVLTSLRYLGAAYLIWLGISAPWPDIRPLFSKRPAALQTRMTNKSTNRPEEDQKRNRSAF